MAKFSLCFNQQLFMLFVSVPNLRRGFFPRSSTSKCTNLFVYNAFLQPEGEDDLKKRQLMELAIINGTYRDTKASTTSTPPTTTNRKLPRSVSLPLGS